MDPGPTRAFWVDAQVRHATAVFKDERMDEHEQRASSSGAATADQQRDLHDDQEQRARLRESMEQAGQQTPSPEGQLEALRQRNQSKAQDTGTTEMNTYHG